MTNRRQARDAAIDALPDPGPPYLATDPLTALREAEDQLRIRLNGYAEHRLRGGQTAIERSLAQQVIAETFSDLRAALASEGGLDHPEAIDSLAALREATYWFRAMVATGGPDGSDLDLAVMQDLDAALGDWEPEVGTPA
jgi:hypothetical protein